MAGPPGYCVDPSGLRETVEATFVLLGSCAVLSEGGLRTAPDQPGVLTVLISAEEDGSSLSVASEDELRSFFDGAEGRAALSPDGRAESILILETRVDDGQVYVRARDMSPLRPDGVDREYWRALFELNGRLVTATLLGFEVDPLEPEEGLETLTALTARLFRENEPGLPE
ncbi:MAG: hypothetical protein AAF871_10570 [Pseudomonadota bacterium]